MHADTPRIVPASLDDGIVINIPEATLYYFERGRLMFRQGGPWTTEGMGNHDGRVYDRDHAAASYMVGPNLHPA